MVYRVVMEDGNEHIVTNPERVRPTGKIAEVYEPVVRATMLAPTDFVGAIMELCQTRRGTLLGMDYLSEDRVEIRYTLPLAEIVFDFFDPLKSKTRGYASLDYEPTGEQAADLVKVDILLHGEHGRRVLRDRAQGQGLRLRRARWPSKLRELIPRQQFEVPIQAAIGARVIARETIRAMRKDVLAKCYGGDITRKRKLLEKQKEGKKRMKMVGRVEVPQEAFIAALSTDRDGRQGQEVGGKKWATTPRRRAARPGAHVAWPYERDGRRPHSPGVHRCARVVRQQPGCRRSTPRALDADAGRKLASDLRFSEVVFVDDVESARPAHLHPGPGTAAGRTSPGGDGMAAVPADRPRGADAASAEGGGGPDVVGGRLHLDPRPHRRRAGLGPGRGRERGRGGDAGGPAGAGVPPAPVLGLGGRAAGA